MSGVSLRLTPQGEVRATGRVAPDQLSRLRARKDELAPLLAAYGEAEVFIRPAMPVPPDPPTARPLAPPEGWRDLDGWRLHCANAGSLVARRANVEAWGRSAGGKLLYDTLLLPAGLPPCLPLVEPQTQAACVGLKVETVEGLPCPPDTCRPPKPKRAHPGKLRPPPVEQEGTPANACIRCREPVATSDMVEAVRLSDGKWEHLSCWLEAST
jgi:hypothetical protein